MALPPGHITYFQTHRARPLSAERIRKGVGTTDAQMTLVRTNLEAAGLVARKPKQASKRTFGLKTSAKRPSRKSR